jgi:S-DNA-T family DNA segregation ATPase FtsK/SpoIIIE
MGRKKKQEEPAEEDQTGFSFTSILDTDAKRGILAVFLFAFSALAFLGYFNGAGLLGNWINQGLGMLVGVGKWLLPFLLIIAGVLLLKRRAAGMSDTVKFVGLLLIFVSTLGLLHLYSGDSSEELLAIAKEGEAGGFLGYVLAVLVLKLAGLAAGTILLLAFFTAGIIATFNVSLSTLLAQVFSKSREKLEAGKDRLRGGTPNEDEEEGNEDWDEEEEEADDTDTLKEHNIQNLSFINEEEEDETEEDVEEEEYDEEEEDETEDEAPKPRRRRRRSSLWELPSVDLLDHESGIAQGGDTAKNQEVIQSTLRHFGIEVEPVGVRVGPTVSQYSFRPGVGVKLTRITTLANDLALALAAQSIRIEAPIPGQSVIGIEIPNLEKARVSLKSLLTAKVFKQKSSTLMLGLGHDVAGQTILADLRTMPHLLIAGRTGSGKSVCINALLLSLLYQNSPEDLKLILVDPKRVELSIYKGIPHLKTDVIVDNKKVINVLKWALSEMERRYKLLEAAHVRDIVSYKEKCRQGEKKVVIDPDTGRVSEEDLELLPYIVIVIDEMADLMIAHGKEVEATIIRLAQMSRAIGIHLILATQRPSVEVLTGLIKANIPTRIAFQVTNQMDSRTILDTSGAEKLLGSGDMLYAASEGKEMKRIQGAFIADDEVRRVVAFWKTQKEELGEDELEDDFGGEEDSIAAALNAIDEGSKEDELYEQAKQVIIDSGRPSTTYLQTALGIGYPRAARLTGLLEKNGIIGMEGGKKIVLIGKGPVHIIEEGKEEEGDSEDDRQTQAERDKWQV